MAWILQFWLASTVFAQVLPAQGLQASPFMSRLELALPVSWEIITTGFGQSRVASVSESYAETWTFHQRAHGENALASPRGKVPVYGLQRVDRLSRMPRALVISEQNFIQLLGIKFETFGETEPRLIYLELENRTEQDNTINLQPNADEIVTISISFHN
ncbi:MAG: hypothetical protein ACOH5I_19640 [Oligoflexus sp.]